MTQSDVDQYLKSFRLALPSSRPDGGNSTEIDEVRLKDITVRRYTNEFWTSRQRQGSSIHEISYRACYKPQLPAFFINLLTQTGDTVYDPFNGRGTSVIEAALLGRRIIANDVNPLSRILTEPRLRPPDPGALADRLAHLPMDRQLRADLDLSMFFHPKQRLKSFPSGAI